MFERSNLKGVDKKALSELPRVEAFSFAENSIEQLSPGASGLLVLGQNRTLIFVSINLIQFNRRHL